MRAAHLGLACGRCAPAAPHVAPRPVAAGMASAPLLASCARCRANSGARAGGRPHAAWPCALRGGRGALLVAAAAAAAAGAAGAGGGSGPLTGQLFHYFQLCAQTLAALALFAVALPPLLSTQAGTRLLCSAASRALPGGRAALTRRYAPTHWAHQHASWAGWHRPSLTHSSPSRHPPAPTPAPLNRRRGRAREGHPGRLAVAPQY
jgi:hypothetical protein